MGRREEYFKMVERIQKKMEDPDVKKEVDDAVAKIEAIFGTQIDLSIVYRAGLEEYKETFDFYNESGYLDEPLPENVMTLGEFKGHLNNESDNNLKLTIDPLYLDKKGINEIYDLIITTLDDRIILVPKNRIDE